MTLLEIIEVQTQIIELQSQVINKLSLASANDQAVTEHENQLAQISRLIERAK